MKIKQASDKANEALEGAAAKVERAGLTKWILVALAIVLIVAIGLWFSKARATGYEHMVIKKIVVVKAVSAPAVVAAPAAAPAATPAAAPAQQPSGGGGGGGFWSWFPPAGVAIYMGAAIRSHMIWCAEDDKKQKKDRKCYRPLRDGMP